jgi:long-chain acyl-CoA synthetase
MRDHLATLLDDFRRFDRATAIVHYQGNRRRVTTYGQIASLAGRFAALLAQKGIGSGDRVLLWAENSADWIAAFYGCMLRGVVAVPLDAAGSADLAARVASDVKPHLAVGDALLVAQLSPEWPRLAFEEWLSLLPTAEMGPISGLSRETPLEILFTSGTTGDPRGVVITHGNVLASVSPIEEGAKPYMRYERLIHPLRILHTLPLSHVFGQTMGLWVPPIFTAELHLENRLAAPRLIETIRRERISVLGAVPRVQALLRSHIEVVYPKLSAKVAASSKIGPLRRWWRFRAIHRLFGLKFWAFVSGGGALAGSLEQFWNTLGFVVVQGYGMTETTALITLNHPFHVAHGTIGKPLPDGEVKLGPDGEVLVRGPMISAATWQNGRMHARGDGWLATGDLVERQESGNLRFLGRKSEVIVTAAGVNVHPEDLEAAVEEQPAVSGCAVVPIVTAAGPEPCAVLAVRGAEEQAARAVEGANKRLAEFQRIRRWVLWPDPDLPRTSTGKVRRKEVSAWLERIQAAASSPGGAGTFAASSDWLLVLIAQISGEPLPGVGDELRLGEDFHLDSLGRVQLAAAIEDRLGIVSTANLLEEVHTLGELRHWIASGSAGAISATPAPASAEAPLIAAAAPTTAPEAAVRSIYPTWPWWKPVQWLRTAFIEAAMRPLVWLLAHPRVVAPAEPIEPEAPLLIVANHVTAYDGALIEHALPGPVRRRVAAAMSAEMLEDFRHARNPDEGPRHGRYYPLGPPAWFLLTALFNVFPLPRLRNFQASFAHAGKAMDHGYHVLVFPEGTRSAEGALARFRPGIGILARQSGAEVLPVGLRGLGELKAGRRRWFRSGIVEVHVGKPIHFAPGDSEAAITARLHDEVARLVGQA